ncbi:MAG: extracellular solute-binding protein [Bacillota bacterium]|nr:extracellular solute-binding protein [Bacillota bacterium]
MKKLFFILFIIITLIVGVGCTVDGQEKLEELNLETTKENVDEKILIYVSGPEEMLNKLEIAFEEEHGDVCDMLKMSCGQIRSKVWTEHEAGKIQADVVWGSDPLIYNKLDDKELLKDITLKEIENIEGEYIVTDRNYVFVNERYVVIMYNKNKFEDIEVPKGYNELMDGKHSNMLVMADANQSSTALGIASALYQINGNGIEYFKNLHDNGTFLTKSNGQVSSKIMEGQFNLGIAPHDGVVRLANKAKKEGYEMPVSIIWPNEGAIAIQRPIAIIKDDSRSENKEEVASKFIDFMVSKKAQTITDNFGFVSVRKDIENRYKPDGKVVNKIDWEMASEHEDTLKKQYQEIFQK